MKSIISTLIVASMLITLVAAANLDDAIERITSREEYLVVSFRNGLSQFPAETMAELNEVLANYDKNIELEVNDIEEEYQRDGFNSLQIKGLVTFYRESLGRVKTALEVLKSNYEKAHAN